MIKTNFDEYKLAELVGIILGDGHMHSTCNSLTIVGSLEDLNYYKQNVISLFYDLFGLKPTIRKRNSENAYYLQLENKEVFKFLMNDIGLIRGNKKNARIPKFILENKKLIPFFLRGLFDTDGCLKFSKQTRNKNYYPRLQFCFRDTFFAKQVKPLLENEGFSVGFWKENRYNGLVFYQISGKENLEAWMNKINPRNMVHVTKYLFWKKHGFYIPKSSLKFILNALN